jgi:tRNA-splicing ligase RtcB (3'-phosphate/5'-hydroxy nucleic acid ligase)
MIELKGKYTDAKIFIDSVEEGVYAQIYDVINSQTSKDLRVRIMPDVHVGSSICIGFSMEMGEYLNPNHVGCDVGCGLLGAKFDRNNRLDLEKTESKIREVMPTGFNIHKSPIINKIDFSEIQKTADLFVDKYNEKFNKEYSSPIFDEKWLKNMLKRIKMDESKFWNSLGTMGGNNHFCELGRDENSDYWITVHTGSRNLGVKVFDYWNNVAKGNIKVLPKEYNNELRYIIDNTIPKSDIPKKMKELKEKYSVGIHKEYLSGDNMFGYLMDMIFTQRYAVLNRELILESIRKILKIKKYDQIISTTHNYVDMRDMIIRKGAVSSYKDELFLLPFNMRDGILILNGKSNTDWNYSSPHGAGRLFSRSKAKEMVDYDEYKKSMKGIVTTSVNKSTIDESPQSYKNSKLIETLIGDTADVVNRIKPILNIKDKSESMSWKERKNKKKKDQDRKRERKETAYRKMKRM